MLVDTALHILYLSPTYAGRVHDKTMADDCLYPLPAGSELWQDLGFLAYELEEVHMHTPHRKPKGGSLTEVQRADNHTNSSIRVRIEHVNSSVKRCRTLRDPLRIRRSHAYDVVMEIGCGLHNFRVRLSPWIPLTQSE